VEQAVIGSQAMKEIVTFLHFDGNCREAMQFYKNCFDAELFLLPFSESPSSLPSPPTEALDRIMHATLKKTSTLLMAADILPGTPYQPGDNFAVILHCESLPELEHLFAALGEKGHVTMPPQDTFWGARFGTLPDRFGIRWMFNFSH
jgi:PhnB protein